MEYDEFSRHVGKAGLKLNEFAALMRMHPNSLSNKRQKGEVPFHLAVIAVLLGEMADNKMDFRALISAIPGEPKKPRGTGFDKIKEDAKSD